MVVQVGAEGSPVSHACSLLLLQKLLGSCSEGGRGNAHHAGAVAG